jgi:class 3 adenylate cyclase
MNCASCGSGVPDDARFCPACGATVGTPATPPAEERKLATVLFADLVGSTELGGAQDPERTRAMLDRFYDSMAAEITRAGGTVEKFVGDAVMAAFGAPAAQEDHAERALHAALAMRRRLDELFGGALRLRIGVNTGEVVVGAPREGSSFVTGDAVNVCARLEQNVDPGEILVGERTAALVRGAFDFGDPLRIDAKGKAGGVECRRLLRALTLMRPRGIGGLPRVFVGRATELDLLETIYRRVVEAREPHLVTLMGDAGLGKSRLVRELWDRLGGYPEQPLRRTGRCLPYGQAITYWPLGEILKEHLGILESDAPDAVRARLGGHETLGLTLGLDPAEEMHPLAARDRLHEAWVEFLAELATERPAVVLVEDIHWAEDPLLDLLERIARDVHAPLLLVATARPELLERRSTWGGGRRNASVVWLEPLATEDAARLVDEELAGALPERLRALIVERAEGNPFFAEELIATLVDKGVLERRNGGWAVNDLADDFQVPDSIHAVLAARIDLLPPVEKSALQAAAVIGRVFWEGPVRELLGGAEPEFSLLEDRDFVRRRPGSSMAEEREYAVKHALTREVAYASLPKARRARLHAAFAEWLERTMEARDEVAPLLAHHYAQAVRPEDVDLAWADQEGDLARLRERAVTWARRAADAAIGRYEIDEGVGLLEGALALEPAPETKAEIWRSLGHAHALTYDGERFLAAMERSLELCVDRATCGDTYSLLAFHTSRRAGMWNRRPDPTLVRGWIDRALELAAADSPARLRALIAKAYWDDDVEAVREADDLSGRLGDIDMRSWALDAVAAVAFVKHRYADGWDGVQRRAEVMPAISDPDHVQDFYETAALGHLLVGKLDEARRLAHEADEYAERLSPHHRVHGVSVKVELEEVGGDWEAVRALSDRVQDAVRANLDTPCVRNQRSLLVCAAACTLAGEADRASELEREAESLGMEGYDIMMNSARIRLALAHGRLDLLSGLVADEVPWLVGFPGTVVNHFDALSVLRERERIERETAPLIGSGGVLEPFALRALGIVREDERLLEQAHERLEALGLSWHAAQTPALLARTA